MHSDQSQKSVINAIEFAERKIQENLLNCRASSIMVAMPFWADAEEAKGREGTPLCLGN